MTRTLLTLFAFFGIALPPYALVTFVGGTDYGFAATCVTWSVTCACWGGGVVLIWRKR